MEEAKQRSSRNPPGGRLDPIATPTPMQPSTPVNPPAKKQLIRFKESKESKESKSIFDFDRSPYAPPIIIKKRVPAPIPQTVSHFPHIVSPRPVPPSVSLPYPRSLNRGDIDLLIRIYGCTRQEAVRLLLQE
jgi:hypothetical protein